MLPSTEATASFFHTKNIRRQTGKKRQESVGREKSSGMVSLVVRSLIKLLIFARHARKLR